MQQEEQEQEFRDIIEYQKQEIQKLSQEMKEIESKVRYLKTRQYLRDRDRYPSNRYSTPYSDLDRSRINNTTTSSNNNQKSWREIFGLKPKTKSPS